MTSFCLKDFMNLDLGELNACKCEQMIDVFGSPEDAAWYTAQAVVGETLRQTTSIIFSMAEQDGHATVGLATEARSHGAHRVSEAGRARKGESTP